MSSTDNATTKPISQTEKDPETNVTSYIVSRGGVMPVTQKSPARNGLTEATAKKTPADPTKRRVQVTLKPGGKAIFNVGHDRSSFSYNPTSRKIAVSVVPGKSDTLENTEAAGYADNNQAINTSDQNGDIQAERKTVIVVHEGLRGGKMKLKRISHWLSLQPKERLLSIPNIALKKNEEGPAIGLIWAKLCEDSKQTREEELIENKVKTDGKEMKYNERIFGVAKEGERSLWISMHGGGNCSSQKNDEQWKNQTKMYALDEGILVTPRAPTDSWNLWHETHIDELVDRLVSNFVMLRGVSPNRIYLMGYSAGGDGVYQLAPRMADRFAAAAMMAGHPNNSDPRGLRNLPFMIFVGRQDAVYKRNEAAVQWGKRLERLQGENPGDYLHKVTIYEGVGHWMSNKDREALPWMAAQTREPWPKVVTWHQSCRTHDRFYWLQVPPGTAKSGQVIQAEVKGQEIAITTTDVKVLTLRLNDKLLDLDQSISITFNGKVAFSGTVERSIKVIWASLQQRMDPRSIATATVTLYGEY